MDFSLDDAQEATRSLAAQILGDLATPARHKELETSGVWFDRDVWSALAAAGLVGIAVPEEHGGAGLGFLEAALVLEEIGRTVAKVPYLPTVVGAMAVAEFADTALAAELLPAVAAGELVIAPALVETRRAVGAPATTLVDGALHGVKSFVPAGLDAGVFLVPAATADGSVVVAVVDAGAAGVSALRQDTTTGIPEAQVGFDGAPVREVLSGDAVAEWLELRMTAGLCATSVGVCEAATRITADYTKTREQFGRPIATFQAVAHRAADAYIDTEAVRLTAIQAAWRIGQGLPAEVEVSVAKFWAAEGGQRVVHAAQHLHGGVGVDRDYPVHRYFLWAKQIELTLGGPTTQLLRIGDVLADTPA